MSFVGRSLVVECSGGGHRGPQLKQPPNPRTSLENQSEMEGKLMYTGILLGGVDWGGEGGGVYLSFVSRCQGVELGQQVGLKSFRLTDLHEFQGHLFEAGGRGGDSPP
jgi:hypothetical protein